MSRIALLSEEVASQVAAGEVVERPASVVKELVENALDANASRVEVVVRRGGISYLRVTDNGFGMDRDDALLCLERHATSKIRSGADLAAIATLGFRGEAIPSIASVSKFRLATREHGALAGTEVLVAGGRLETVRDCGEPPGTMVEVRSLFFNLPARRKFLRTETTEFSHVEHQMELQALGHSGVAFTLVSEDRVVFQLPAAATLLERIRDLRGAPAAAELLEVPLFEREGFRVWGYVGKAGVSRSGRQQQLVFLNGRPVENPVLNVGLREGYHTALMKGQHPVTYLFIEMDPAEVDVNVHPAKREVRFRDGNFVREAVVQAVRAALETDRASWSAALRPEGFGGIRPGGASMEPQSVQPSEFQPALIPQEQQLALRRDWSALPVMPVRPADAEPGRLEAAAELLAAGPLEVENSGADSASAMAPWAEPAVERRSEGGGVADDSGGQEAPGPESARDPSLEFRILGVLGRLYVLMENRDGLVLVDQHAAHERILYERMKRQMEVQGVPAQRLLLPLNLQVSPRDSDWLMRNLELLERAGIVLEPFGGGTFKIDTLPTFLKGGDPLQLVRGIVDELQEASQENARLRLGEDMIAKTVCRHAVKANDDLRQPELVRLLRDLLACELPYCCPHGRPTMIQIGYLELEKKFGRKA